MSTATTSETRTEYLARKAKEDRLRNAARKRGLLAQKAPRGPLVGTWQVSRVSDGLRIAGTHVGPFGLTLEEAAFAVGAYDARDYT